MYHSCITRINSLNEVSRKIWGRPPPPYHKPLPADTRPALDTRAQETKRGYVCIRTYHPISRVLSGHPHPGPPEGRPGAGDPHNWVCHLNDPFGDTITKFIKRNRQNLHAHTQHASLQRGLHAAARRLINFPIARPPPTSRSAATAPPRIVAPRSQSMRLLTFDANTQDPSIFTFKKKLKSCQQPITCTHTRLATTNALQICS